MNREEAARILDPETSAKALREYGDGNAQIEACDEACRIAAVELRSKPTGEALTMEQLRGMDGEKVLVRELETGREYKETLKKVSESGVYLIDEDGEPDYGAVELYGETWLAYAYPPAHIDREAWTAEWIYPENEFNLPRCSKCGCNSKDAQYSHKDNFCPKCGRAMTQEGRAIMGKRLRG